MNDIKLQYIPYTNLINWSVQYLKTSNISYNKKYDLVEIGNFLRRNKTNAIIENNKIYKRVTIKINNGGVFLRDTEKGVDIGTKRQYLVSEGQFVMSKIDARNGAFGMVPKDLVGAIVTNDFPVFDIDQKQINPIFFINLISTGQFLSFAQNSSSGTTGRKRIDMDLFLKVKIPLPPLNIQDKIVKEYNQKTEQAKRVERKSNDLENSIEKYLMEELGIKVADKKKKKKGLQFVEFKELDRWDIWNRKRVIKSTLYTSIKIKNSIKKITDKIFKIQKKDYKQQGALSIISQEDILISGYTDKDVKPISNKNLPLVVFGDHSKTVKYIDFPFVCGADGVRILKPIDEFRPMFFYFFISYIVKYIKTTQVYTRHWKYLSEFLIPLLPCAVQEKIIKKISAIKSEIKNLKDLAVEKRKSAIQDFENKIFND